MMALASFGFGIGILISGVLQFLNRMLLRLPKDRPKPRTTRTLAYGAAFLGLYALQFWLFFPTLKEPSGYERIAGALFNQGILLGSLFGVIDSVSRLHHWLRR